MQSEMAALQDTKKIRSRCEFLSLSRCKPSACFYIAFALSSFFTTLKDRINTSFSLSSQEASTTSRLDLLLGL
jgi:hypothetical protein